MLLPTKNREECKALVEKYLIWVSRPYTFISMYLIALRVPSDCKWDPLKRIVFLLVRLLFACDFFLCLTTEFSVFKPAWLLATKNCSLFSGWCWHRHIDYTQLCTEKFHGFLAAALERRLPEWAISILSRSNVSIYYVNYNLRSTIDLSLVVQRAENTIQWINCYTVDKCYLNVLRYCCCYCTG